MRPHCLFLPLPFILETREMCRSGPRTLRLVAALADRFRQHLRPVEALVKIHVDPANLEADHCSERRRVSGKTPITSEYVLAVGDGGLNREFARDRKSVV